MSFSWPSGCQNQGVGDLPAVPNGGKLLDITAICTDPFSAHDALFLLVAADATEQGKGQGTVQGVDDDVQLLPSVAWPDAGKVLYRVGYASGRMKRRNELLAA
jgi:hypothetical protein